MRWLALALLLGLLAGCVTPRGSMACVGIEPLVDKDEELREEVRARLSAMEAQMGTLTRSQQVTEERVDEVLLKVQQVHDGQKEGKQ